MARQQGWLIELCEALAAARSGNAGRQLRDPGRAAVADGPGDPSDSARRHRRLTTLPVPVASTTLIMCVALRLDLTEPLELVSDPLSGDLEPRMFSQISVIWEFRQISCSPR